MEQNADIMTRDGEDRTPRDMAIELKSIGAWRSALQEVGMNEYGIKRGNPFRDVCHYST